MFSIPYYTTKFAVSTRTDVLRGSRVTPEAVRFSFNLYLGILSATSLICTDITSACLTAVPDIIAFFFFSFFLTL